VWVRGKVWGVVRGEADAGGDMDDTYQVELSVTNSRHSSYLKEKKIIYFRFGLQTMLLDNHNVPEVVDFKTVIGREIAHKFNTWRKVGTVFGKEW